MDGSYFDQAKFMGQWHTPPWKTRHVNPVIPQESNSLKHRNCIEIMAIDIVEPFRPSSIDLPQRKSLEATVALTSDQKSRKNRESLASRERPGKPGSRR